MLDGVRAVVALLVVLYHCGLQRVPGGLGVLVFFVLSGFLITWRLLEEDDASGTVSLKHFYFRRALRIVPPFYVYWILLTGALVLLDKRILWGQAIASLLYVGNYYQAIGGDPNTGYSHTWSLAIEEQFYLLWPLLFRRFRADRQALPRGLAIGVLTIWVYRLVIRFGLGVGQSYVYEAFDTRADHLMIGCLLAVVLRAGWGARFWALVCGQPWRLGLPVGLLAISTAAQNTWGHGYRDGVGFIVDPVLTAIALAQLIALRSTLPARWLDRPFSRFLGRISYSTYLYQQIVVEPVLRGLGAVPRFAGIAVAVAAVHAVAAVSHYLVERPFLRLGRGARGGSGARRVAVLARGERLVETPDLPRFQRPMSARRVHPPERTPDAETR